jgi:hypothetical protein
LSAFYFQASLNNDYVFFNSLFLLRLNAPNGKFLRHKTTNVFVNMGKMSIILTRIPIEIVTITTGHVIKLNDCEICSYSMVVYYANVVLAFVVVFYTSVSNHVNSAIVGEPRKKSSKMAFLLV